MLKFVDFKVTFQEIPDEIPLCINLSNCPHRCKGCHSAYLQEDIGTVLTKQILDKMIESNIGITCVCFMGGDNDISKLLELAKHVRENHFLKTAWYTGTTWETIDKSFLDAFDYIKAGPYNEDCGPISSPSTNQRFFAKDSDMWQDITSKFWKEP